MNKRIRLFSTLLILAISVLSCALPTNGINVTPTSSSDQVATVVASTLQAFTPQLTDITPNAMEDLLPRTFYYRGTDDTGLAQVFRLERDGTTRRQLTAEPVDVTDYDVSLANGGVAYIADNQLLLVNADGSGRRLLVDGGPVDENNPFLSVINSPVFSPDGGMLAYGYKGLNLQDISTGISQLVIENQIDDRGGGLLIPKELYWPERYSPDGTKLLITLGYYEGASAAVYDPATNELVRLQGGEGALICCDDMEWSPDGSSFYSASPTAGMFNSGMWKVDASSGAVTTLFASSLDSNSYVYADESYPAPDGQLYFFFAETNREIMSRTPLQPVRSAPDGVTDRTILLSETFEYMNEALWAPDASFIVVASAPTPDVYQGGQADAVYLDGRPNVVLANFAQQMKWGR